MSNVLCTYEDIELIAETLAEDDFGKDDSYWATPNLNVSRDLEIDGKTYEVILEFHYQYRESYIETVELCLNDKVIWTGYLDDFIDEYKVSEEDLQGNERIWRINNRDEIAFVLEEDANETEYMLNLVKGKKEDSNE